MNLTQDELAEKADIGKRSISKYEKGPEVPKLDTAQKLAAALDCSVNWLLTGEASYPSAQTQPQVLNDAPSEQVQSTLSTLRSQAQSMIQQIDLLQKQMNRPVSSTPLSEAQAVLQRAAGEAGDPK